MRANARSRGRIQLLFLGEVDEDVAVGVEDLGFGDEAEVLLAVVDNGEVPGTGVLEDLHDLLHRHIVAEDGLGVVHQLSNGETVIEAGLEHDVTYLVEQEDALQFALVIDHGEDITLAVSNDLDELAKGHVGRDGTEIGLEDVIHLEEGEHGAIFVMGEEFAFLRQTHGVEAVGLEDHDGEVRDDRHDHQRHKQVVTAGEFGDEEDTRERCVHDAGHQARHAHEGEVDDRYRDAHRLEQIRQDKAHQRAHEQRGREDTADAATAVGRHRSHDLENKHKHEVGDDEPRAAIERCERAVLDVIERIVVEEGEDNIVSFAVQWREEVDKQAEHRSADEDLSPHVRDALEVLLEPVHTAGEVQRDKAARHAEQQVPGDALQGERLDSSQLEHRREARGEIGDSRSGDG